MQLTAQFIILISISGLSLIISLIALYLTFVLRRHYDTLTHGVEPKHLIKALEGIQKTLAEHERSATITRKELKSLEADVKTHLQTLTLKRFNPFSDTGGDQSFILAILDGNQDGIIMTSLHSRENTRFYVKSVKGGVGDGHQLSPDEQKIIKRN